MNNEFIKIKSMDGELKISHKKRDFGISVSTEELILQKPHVNYHIKLNDILSIVPFKVVGSKDVRITKRYQSSQEIVTAPIHLPHYKFFVKKAIVHNRNGIFELGPTEFVLPILRKLLLLISEHGELESILK